MSYNVMLAMILFAIDRDMLSLPTTTVVNAFMKEASNCHSAEEYAFHYIDDSAHGISIDCLDYGKYNKVVFDWIRKTFK